MQAAFKNDSRRGDEVDLGAKSTSASLPRRLRFLRGCGASTAHTLLSAAPIRFACTATTRQRWATPKPQRRARGQ